MKGEVGSRLLPRIALEPFVPQNAARARPKIARHVAKCFQQNRVRELTAGRIACTAERDRTDMSLSSRHSLSTSYRRIRTCAFDSFARLRSIVASTESERYIIGHIGHDAIN